MGRTQGHSAAWRSSEGRRRSQDGDQELSAREDHALCGSSSCEAGAGGPEGLARTSRPRSLPAHLADWKRRNPHMAGRFLRGETRTEALVPTTEEPEAFEA